MTCFCILLCCNEYDDFMLDRQLKEKGTFTLDKSKNSPVLQRIPYTVDISGAEDVDRLGGAKEGLPQAD